MANQKRPRLDLRSKASPGAGVDSDDDHASTAAASTTARDARSCNFCFTLNNYCAADIDFLKEVPCKYMSVGEELGESATPHLQGQICFKEKKSWKAAKAALGPRYHIEVTADLDASIRYTQKEGKFFEVGQRPIASAKARGKLGGDKEKERWALTRSFAEEGRFEEIDDQIFIQHLPNLEKVRARSIRTMKWEPTFATNYWFVGESGSGKSRKAREMWPTLFPKMLNKWWDGFDPTDHEVVLLEDVDPDTCQRMSHWFKVWSDHYPFPAEVKSACMTIRPRCIVVTSNYTIEQCFPRAADYTAIYRRYQVVEFSLNAEPKYLPRGVPQGVADRPAGVPWFAPGVVATLPPVPLARQTADALLDFFEPPGSTQPLVDEEAANALVGLQDGSISRPFVVEDHPDVVDASDGEGEE